MEMAVHKTSQKEERTKEPSWRSPKLWPLVVLLLGCTFGGILFGFVHQNSSTGVVVVGGLLVLAAVAVAVTVIGAVGAAGLVTWITVMVFLWLIGRSRRRLVAEGRKISKEIMVGFVVRVLLKEGNVLGAISAAVFGYLGLCMGSIIISSYSKLSWLK